MGHNHHHNHTKEPNKKNLLFSVALNFLITLVEFIGGLLSNSLSLISDALHNLSDTIAIFLSYIALLIGEKSPDEKNTFGYKRIEILASLFNSIVLIVISFYLFYEAYKRFINPEPINEKIMFIVASIGLIANLVSMLMLKKDANYNLNIKSAYLHLVGDTLSSIGVIIGSILIYYYQIHWIDPLLTVLIGLFILKETFPILKESFKILMQASPSGLNINEIKTNLEDHPSISNIHHIHSWSLTDNKIHFECHADLNKDFRLSETDKIRLDLEEILQHKYNIDHITIQMEYNCCDEKNMVEDF